MRVVILALAFACSAFSPTTAFDGKKVADEYYSAREVCRIGIDSAGNPLPEAETQAACDTLSKLGKELTDHGWCWDKSEVEWVVCPKAS